MTPEHPEISNTVYSLTEIESTNTFRSQLPFKDWPELMGHKEIIKFAGLSHDQAWMALKSNQIHRPFPKKRGMVVGKYALRDFINGRTIGDSEVYNVTN